MTNGRDYVTANLTLPTHPCHTERLDGSSHEEPAMTKVPSASFSPELLTLMRSALDTDSGEALLDRLGSIGRDFLSELPKFPVLRGHGFDVLAALRR